MNKLTTLEEINIQEFVNYLRARMDMAKYRKEGFPPNGYWSRYYTGKIDAYREALKHLKSVDRKE